MSEPIIVHPQAALSLALAVVAASATPMLLLDGSLIIIAMSTSFRRDFRIQARDPVGTPLSALGDGEWSSPKLQSLLSATASGIAEIDAYEIDLEAPDGRRRLRLNAHKLSYDDDSHVRILLSVADITEARAAEKLKDDLLREKAVLLQEVQHRVANSLQIIASVILQSARRAQSEESRARLKDAHLRVMSVAQLQHQLAHTDVGDVEVRRYLQDLCKSIGASMIRDDDQILLSATADDSVTSAHTSVSLGLIVTELVINSLKHAFPAARKGKISVDYRSDDADWSLTVSDDGVGMPPLSENAKAGLGTSIVTALADQLEATIDVSDAQPGTLVSIKHVAGAAPTNTPLA